MATWSCSVSLTINWSENMVAVEAIWYGYLLIPTTTEQGGQYARFGTPLVTGGVAFMLLLLWIAKYVQSMISTPYFGNSASVVLSIYVVLRCPRRY